MTSDLAFFLRSWRDLRFGFLLMALSSAGQTYYVALYGAAIRATFGIGDGELGAAYAAGTLASAATLTVVGPWIDRTSVPRFTIGVGLLLTVACLVTASVPNAWLLVPAFFLLRLGGQGLMVHTAMTSTARLFPNDVGKALGVISLGMSAAAVVLPLTGVAVLDAIGWRWSFAVNAAGVALGTLAAVLLCPTGAAQDVRTHAAASARTDAGPLWRDRRLWLTLPVIVAPSFIVTGFFFHQGRLAQEKGWPLSWIALWFGAHAVTQAIVQLAAGPLIDRLGPKRILPVALLPLCGAMATLWLLDGLWTAPAYLTLMGISSALVGTLATAIWMQLYGPEHLGRLRSLAASAAVVASAASPVLMGVLIDRGMPLGVQAAFCLAAMLAASALARRL